MLPANGMMRCYIYGNHVNLNYSGHAKNVLFFYCVRRQKNVFVCFVFATAAGGDGGTVAIADPGAALSCFDVNCIIASITETTHNTLD